MSRQWWWRWHWCLWTQTIFLLVATMATKLATAASLRPCAHNALCYCRTDHFACNYVPFHRFPETGAGVAHVAVSQARLGALPDAALDARPLRTLVLVASHLHHIETAALASMVSTLASLDLGYNDFTEVPVEALRELKVLNWLNLQNNFIDDIEPFADWGFLADSLSSLSLSNNHLSTLSEGAFSSLRQLAQLDLDGNRLRIINANSLPPSISLLRLSDNLLEHLPCLALEVLTRLRYLHMRNNMLRSASNRSCASEHSKIDLLDLSNNELADGFVPDFQYRLQLRQLILDFNDFTSVPPFVLEFGRLEKLSISYNKLVHVSDATVHALRYDLERLELDHNEMRTLPASVRDLLRLRHLSLAYNRLEYLPDLPLFLHSLSVAGNYLSTFPIGLHDIAPATLTYLDIGYNQISTIPVGIFGKWSTALVTLNLKGNKIIQLSADGFPGTLPLRELALSFNDLYYVDIDAFVNLTLLRSLELSSTLFSGDFPVLSYLEKLTWLSLDNNNIHYITSEDLQNYPSLEYINLDFNKIMEFPSDIINSNYTSRLRELRVSYNYLGKLNFNFLSDLEELQSVDISHNRVKSISERSFINLPNLVYLSLAENLIDMVSERAFCHLPALEILDMQRNELVEFSTKWFENVSNDDTNFSVNMSRNRISHVKGGSNLFLNILDLSYNILESLPNTFFNSIGMHVREIYLSHNRLKNIDYAGFGILPKLGTLSLHHNNLTVLKKKAIGEIPSLQMVDLSKNELSQLAVEQFYNMRRLRHLRLDANELRTIPRDAFKNTVLEHLDLSENRLTIFPSSALAQVGFTLRRLEMAGNRFEYLDSAMFHAIVFLHELNLARNALTVLPDNAFASLMRLRRLDLSGNAIKTNFRELFHNVPCLRRLGLADVGLRAVPTLFLANLTELDLSGNQISSFREADVRGLSKLRALDLSRNRFTSLRPTMWVALWRLASLDISQNPIVRVTRSSFEGLDRLLHLRMERLLRLEAVEPRAFRPLVALRSLMLESTLGDGRVPVSVADVVLSTPALESLLVHVRESVLSSQLHGLQGSKLRVLEVRGASLRHVTEDAFVALGRQRALSLRLSGTSVSALPAGLVRPLVRIPHLGLDLSDNRLVTFNPATLYPNLTGWNRLATRLLPGGLVVSGNPLRCGCAVSWVSAWLRRWAAEVGAGSREARREARRATCEGEGGTRVLLALAADEAECHASALSARAGPPPSPSRASRRFLLWVLLAHLVRSRLASNVPRFSNISFDL